MPLPHSFNIALTKAEKRLADLEASNPNFKDPRQRTEVEVEIGELAASLTLLMDKTMNAVFDKFGAKAGNKPNIYFPDCRTATKFQDKLKQYRLTGLLDANPALLEVLQEPQSYQLGEKSWWPTLATLARGRHEGFPEIAFQHATCTAIGGIGQDVFVEKLVTGPSGSITELRGIAWSRATGLREPLQVAISISLEDVLADTGMEPLAFLRTAVVEASKLLKRIGVHL